MSSEKVELLIMKKVFLILAMSLLLIVILDIVNHEITSPATIGPYYYNAGASSPSIISFYGANNCSSKGYWDLTNNTNIATGAVIYSITEQYTQTYPYNDLKVGLFNGANTGYYIYSGTSVPQFVGQPAKQKWYTQCHAKYSGWIQPVLRIFWTAPSSSTISSNGMTTLLPDGSSETAIMFNDLHVPGSTALSN